jgi:hypothetical protein
MLLMIGWCAENGDVIGVSGHPKHGTAMRADTAERVLVELGSSYPDHDYWLESCEGEKTLLTGSALLEGLFAHRYDRPRWANPYTDETLKAAWDRGWGFDDEDLGGPPEVKA